MDAMMVVRTNELLHVDVVADWQLVSRIWLLECVISLEHMFLNFFNNRFE